MNCRTPSLVYFIKPIGLDGPIKIGCASVPAHRLEGLAAWSPWPLEVIGSVPGSYAEEAFLHSCFADSHSHREWFFVTPRLRSMIEEILAAGSIQPARDKLVPVRKIRRRKPPTEWETKYRSYSARVRCAVNRLRCDDTDDQIVYFSAAPNVQAIIDRWYGRSHYTLPRNPVLPSVEELALLDRFIADPIGQGAVKHVIKRIHPSRESAA